jgi:hypothetical protein
LRSDQILLLLANLSRRELTECTISIEESPLDGEYGVEVLFGEGVFADLNIAEDGSLTDYALPEVIEPFQRFILLLDQP